MRYGNATFQYTANGELQLKAEGADTTRYTYDELGNLITVLLPSGDRIDYLIDGQNRRVGRKLNGVLERQWLYESGLRVVAELDGTGALVSRFVYGSRGHVPDYMVRAGTSYRVIADHLGSVRMVVNVANGTIAQRLDFDAWGNVLSDSSPGFQPFGFAGGLSEAPSTFVRFGVRDYFPQVARWTSKDPVVFGGGQANLFAYVLSDPVNLLDPSGLASASFDPCTNTFTVRNKAGDVIATFQAGNATVNPSGDPNQVDSNGPAPPGTFPLQPPIQTGSHKSYGPYFFPVGGVGPNGERLDIARKRGIGLHGGRKSYLSRTQGCIRFNNEDIILLTQLYVLQLFAGDPIDEVTIQGGHCQ